MAQVLANRVLPFDHASADAAARLSARRLAQGFVLDLRDTQIAGIVIARKAALATGNLKHFADLECDVVSPWQ